MIEADKKINIEQLIDFLIEQRRNGFVVLEIRSLDHSPPEFHYYTPLDLKPKEDTKGRIMTKEEKKMFDKFDEFAEKYKEYFPNGTFDNPNP